MTNIANSALAGGKGTLYGKTDSNISGGLDVKVFTERAVRAIYFRERESIISDKFVYGVAPMLRNVFPNLIFKIMELRRQKEQRLKMD